MASHNSKGLTACQGLLLKPCCAEQCKDEALSWVTSSGSGQLLGPWKAECLSDLAVCSSQTLSHSWLVGDLMGSSVGWGHGPRKPVPHPSRLWIALYGDPEAPSQNRSVAVMWVWSSSTRDLGRPKRPKPAWQMLALNIHQLLWLTLLRNGAVQM